MEGMTPQEVTAEQKLQAAMNTIQAMQEKIIQLTLENVDLMSARIAATNAAQSNQIEKLREDALRLIDSEQEKQQKEA